MSINLLLVLSISIVSYISFNNSSLYNKLIFSPYIIARQKQFTRFITSAWLHADYMHLIINMIVLFSFGQFLESVMNSFFGNIGSLLYLILFLGAVIIAHIPSYMKEKDSYHYGSVGASGGTSGVLFATILLNPWQQLELFFFLPIPGIVFGILYLWYSQRMAQRAQDNINHSAHIFGALAGMLFLILMKPSVVPYFFEQLISNFI